MTPNPDISRRTALAAGLAGAGTVALAACSSGSSTGGGSGTRSDETGGAASAGQPVATVADIKVGGCVAAKIGDNNVIVSRPTASTVACFSAICTHQGCTVQPSGNKLECPCHGSVFNALTGAVLQGPASSPLPAVAVKIDKGQVVTTGKV